MILAIKVFVCQCISRVDMVSQYLYSHGGFHFFFFFRLDVLDDVGTRTETNVASVSSALENASVIVIFEIHPSCLTNTALLMNDLLAALNLITPLIEDPVLVGAKK